MPNSDIIRAAFQAYFAQDRATREFSASRGLRLHQSAGRYIDKTAFLQRCFPTAQRLTSQDLLYAIDLPGNDVFIMYEYELKTGDRHRNTEVITVRDGQLVETQVFFGGKVS